ncbi:MAG: response regulator, partial [Pirellulaceae bacterium]|nr:response regulator [Pirellulaceae bacterium]
KGKDCEDVHLVLIDYHMPFMSGLEALRTIKNRKRLIPVILMSAQLDDQMSAEALAADAWSVHPKPLDISRIRGDVSSALQTIYNWSIDC